MPRPPKHRPWHEADLARLHHHFLDGASLEKLVALLMRQPEDIINTLHTKHLLMVRGGNYYRVHPTPFAPSSQSKAHSPPSEELSSEDEPSIDILELPTRCVNVLARYDIRTVSQLCRQAETDLLVMAGMGRNYIRQIKEGLEDRGYKLQPYSLR